MNISPVNVTGINQNFASKKAAAKEKQFGRWDNTYIYPITEEKVEDNTQTEEEKTSNKDLKEPKKIVRRIHYMSYGDGIPVPVVVEEVEE